MTEHDRRIVDATSALTRDAARRFFDELLRMSCALPGARPSCIPVAYTNDFCWAVANRICQEAEGRGITMAKMWVRGRLKIRMPQRGAGTQTWEYHVAPFVRLTGRTPHRVLILDPVVGSLDGPMLRTVWLRALGDPRARVHITDRLVYRLSVPGDDVGERPGETEQDLEMARGRLRPQARGGYAPSSQRRMAGSASLCGSAGT